jgi:hypothetical protein
MQNQYSKLKIFCGWLGRPGIIDNSGQGVGAYLPEVDPASLKPSVVAEKSKSLTGNGIDIMDVLRKAESQDSRYAAMLKVGLVFGLRKKEMLKIKLWRADQINFLEIDGSVAKSGRYRRIQFEEGVIGQIQRILLDEVKGMCKKSEALGWPGLTYKQSENRYYYYAKRIGLTKEVFGVTGHGSRAEFLESMTLANDLVPATLGGQSGQMSKIDQSKVLLKVSNLGGHGRIDVMSSYVGTFKKVALVDGIGGLMGPIILDAANDVVAQIYCNPAPIKGPDGAYRIQNEQELSQTVLTAVLYEDGVEGQQVDVEEFLTQHPGAVGKLHMMLEARGLGR